MSNKKQIVITINENDNGFTTDYLGGISPIEVIGISEFLKKHAIDKVLNSKENQLDTSNHQMD
jgi:hypothetical protein